MTLPRPCRTCNIRFQPYSKHNRICANCKSELQKEIIKNRKRHYKISAYELLRLAKTKNSNYEKRKPSTMLLDKSITTSKELLKEQKIALEV